MLLVNPQIRCKGTTNIWNMQGFAQKNAPEDAFLLTRVSVLPARSCRTDKYVSCRGRDRVCRMLLEPLPQLCPFAIFQPIHYFHLIVGKGLFGKLSELIGVYRFQYDLFRFEIKQELHVRRQRE